MSNVYFCKKQNSPLAEHLLYIMRFNGCWKCTLQEDSIFSLRIKISTFDGERSCRLGKFFMFEVKKGIALELSNFNADEADNLLLQLLGDFLLFDFLCEFWSIGQVWGRWISWVLGIEKYWLALNNGYNGKLFWLFRYFGHFLHNYDSHFSS